MESVGLNGLHERECWVTLCCDSPIRDGLFNTGWVSDNLVNDPEKITTPLCAHEKHQPQPPEHVKIFNPPQSSYFVYT